MRCRRLMLVYTVIKYNNNIAGGDISNLVQDFFFKTIDKNIILLCWWYDTLLG